MSDPYVGEIRMFAGNFAPRSWAFCDGQLLQVSQNNSLFSLFGTIYGGDGRTTFGLPELRGRVPIHYGSGPGLTPRKLGAKGGTENETLSINTMPSHSHTWQASSQPPTESRPAGNVTASAIAVGDPYADAPSALPGPATNRLADGAIPAITKVGGGQSHANVQPFQCIYYIVSLQGVYPSRT